MKKKFSIITCTYNSEAYLKECIASVVLQRNKNYEHVFVDAHSTDNTLRIIKAYQKKFPTKVKLFMRNKTGISDAMNYGIEQSKGSIVCHLHSDDLFYSKDVLNQVETLFNRYPRAGAVIGDCLFKNGDQMHRVFPKEYSKRKLLFLFPTIYLFSSNRIPHPSVFLSKKTISKYGNFSTTLKTTMDYDLWFRIVPKTQVVFTEYCLSVYRVHNQTTSNLNSNIVKKEISNIIVRYAKEYPIAYYISKLSKRISILR